MTAVWLPAMQPVSACEHHRAPAAVELYVPRQARALAGEALREISGPWSDRKLARRVAADGPIHPDDVQALATRMDGLAQVGGRDGLSWRLLGGDRAWAWARRAVREMPPEAPVSRTLWSTPGLTTRSAPRKERERGRVWRSWLGSVQRPTERAITAQWRTRRGGIFHAQAKRYADRVAAVLGGRRSVRRNVTRDELDAILMREAELAAILDQFDERVIERGLARAFDAAARRVGEDLALVDLLDVRDLQIADMVTNVSATTEARIARIIEAGTEAGASIADIQKAIQRDAAFSPQRALRVGRTETARTLSEGTDAAYVRARDEAGARFRVQWLSSRDGAVRESHQPGGGLDGQTVDVGALFVAPSGVRARGPGLFGRDSGKSQTTAAEDIHCRCTTIPTDIGG